MILVTGSTGLIGSHLCKKLVSEGYEVVGLVHHRINSLSNALLQFGNFEMCVGDIRHGGRIDKIITDYGVKTIFHTAAQLPYSSGKDLVGVNVGGVLNLLNSGYSNKVEEFIFASSMGVYSDPPDYLPVDEVHPTRPTSMYGLTKLTGELQCGVYAEAMRVTILRYAGVYGISSEKNRAVNNFIRCALSNRPLIVDGDGSQSSDFVYVDDIVQGTYRAWKKQVEGIYNIGSGLDIKIRGLASLIVSLTNSKSELMFNGKHVGRPFRFYLDITKAKKELGYSPHRLIDGLIEYIKEGFNGRISQKD